MPASPGGAYSLHPGVEPGRSNVCEIGGRSSGSLLDPRPWIYVTNRNSDSRAWKEIPEAIADANLTDFDGMIDVGVFKLSYRVRWWRYCRRSS